MKKILVSLVLSLMLSSFVFSQNIKEIKIGKSIWMAENLRVWAKESWSYNDDPKNDLRFGRLYTWDAAKNSCPFGWHLPTSNEWDQLIEFLGGSDQAGGSLKMGGTSGFNARLGGFSNVGSYMLINTYGAYWTSTPYDVDHSWYIFLNAKDNQATKTYFTKTYGLSVRCVKNQ
jgi:uncharacterized protein (TIGR02145 family)